MSVINELMRGQVHELIGLASSQANRINEFTGWQTHVLTSRQAATILLENYHITTQQASSTPRMPVCFCRLRLLAVCRLQLIVNFLLQKRTMLTAPF